MQSNWKCKASDVRVNNIEPYVIYQSEHLCTLVAIFLDQTLSPELMLGALNCCWAQLAGVSGGEILYSGFRIIIKFYLALSLAIGGQDGMDGGGGHWMTCSINRTCHQSWCLRIVFVIGDVAYFFHGNIYIWHIYTYSTLFCASGEAVIEGWHVWF